MDPNSTYQTPGHKLAMAGPDRLVLTEGGGCVMIVGICMVAAGAVAGFLGTEVEDNAEATS